MPRLLSISILLVAVSMALLPQPGQAKGAALKGTLITQQGQGIGSTGDCLCEWTWYTVGAKPGTLTISARMSTPKVELAKIWQMTMVLFRGSNVVTSKSVVCQAIQKHCQPLATIKVHVHQRGVYYIRMEGFAASQIPFIIRVVGPVVPLHCVKGTC